MLDAPLHQSQAPSHAAVEAAADRGRDASIRTSRVLIVGAGAMGQSVARLMAAQDRYQVVGFLDDEASPGPDACDLPILGSKSDALRLVQELSIDQVLVAYAPSWQQDLLDGIALHGHPVQVSVVPSYYEAMLCSPRLQSIGDIALIPLAISANRRGLAKRAFDLLLSVAALLFFLPASLLTAIAVALTSPGPILFVQERVGHRGQVFGLIKFRTMRNDAESATGPVLSAGKTDARLTPIGRWLRLFRLDEVPQLINVVRGEMSLVGPRPERPHFVAKFAERNPVYRHRHDVRPGITGLAQLHGGYHTDARDKLRFDLFYASHHSLWLDISVLARTVLKILMRPDGC